eukprot:9142262-Lingulodinium_polyedra.AAC.1
MRDDCSFPQPGGVPAVLVAWSVMQPLRACTDGSCLYPAIRGLRRAGWAVVFAQGHPLNASAALRGAIQTAPRAEARAVLSALEITRGCVHIVTDSFNCARAGVQLVEHGVLPSLTTFSWLRAHQHGPFEHDEQACNDWRCNQLADMNAAAAAQMHEPSFADVQRVFAARLLVQVVQQWLALALALVVELEGPVGGARRGPRRARVV